MIRKHKRKTRRAIGRQQADSNRLREMGNIKKIAGWESHELDDREMEKRKSDM